MSVDKAALDDVTDRDLLDLIEYGVQEGLNIEYKEALYSHSDRDHHEALKDISSLANTAGGHLIIGMKAPKGLPSELVGLSGIDPDAELLRLNQLCQQGLAPRIVGLQMRAVPMEGDRYAMVVRVPRSWNLPHRVILKNSNRFYFRNPSGVHEADVEELRRAFLLADHVAERARRFRVERLGVINRMEGPLHLMDGGRLIVHVVPLAAYAGQLDVDMRRVFENRHQISTIGQTTTNARYNLDGVLISRLGPECHGYTQIFRDGSIEATYAGVVHERDELPGIRFIPGRDFHDRLIVYLCRALEGLKLSGVPAPIVVMISITNVLGVYFAVHKRMHPSEEHPIDRRDLVLPAMEIDQYGTDEHYQRTLRPVFDALWNSFGYEQALYFNDEGLYTGRLATP